MAAHCFCEKFSELQHFRLRCLSGRCRSAGNHVTKEIKKYNIREQSGITYIHCSAKFHFLTFMHHHRILLKNFTPKDGTISFSTLVELSEKLTALAESAVLSLVEGNSRPGQGKRPEEVKEVTDFTQSGLHEGSTVPEPGAPDIQSISQNKPFGMFDEPESEELIKDVIGYNIAKIQLLHFLSLFLHSVGGRSAPLACISVSFFPACTGFKIFFSTNQSSAHKTP